MAYRDLTLEDIRAQIKEVNPSLVILSKRDAWELTQSSGIMSAHGLVIDQVPIAVADLFESWTVRTSIDGEPIINPWSR